MSALKCPLCASPGTESEVSISGAELRMLFAEMEIPISEAAYGNVTSSARVALFRCATCGFRFFDPRFAGSGQFYSELEKNSYYPATRPEFELAWKLSNSAQFQRVMDVGCGDGRFLDVLQALGKTTLGVELNPTASAAVERKGHRVFRRMLHELSNEEVGGPVDLLTFFQVLEHVADPVGVLRSGAAFVRMGGLVVVSVPSSEGVRRLVPLDPANMPPHHLSLWRRRDLILLADRAELDVVRIGRDVLYGPMISEFMGLQNRLSRAIGRGRPFGPQWIPKLLGLIYRKLGIRYLRPPLGLSAFAVLRKR